MVELQVRRGREAGAVVPLTHFPFAVGRRGADFLLTEPGVWDRHFAIQPGEKFAFILVPAAEAPVAVAGQMIREPQPLRNGDLIDCGAAQLQFRLTPTRPRGLAWREHFVWAMLGALLLFQLAAAFGWRP